jgi:hypothetical protein
MRLTLDRSWLPWALLGLGGLILLAPVFDFAATAVGYTEPLGHAAAAAGAVDAEISVYSGLLPEYSVPGSESAMGTLVAAAIGTAITFIVAIGLGRLLEQ